MPPHTSPVSCISRDILLSYPKKTALLCCSQTPPPPSITLYHCSLLSTSQAQGAERWPKIRGRPVDVGAEPLTVGEGRMKKQKRLEVTFPSAGTAEAERPQSLSEHRPRERRETLKRDSWDPRLTRALQESFASHL